MNGTKPICQVPEKTNLEAFVNVTNNLGLHKKCKYPCCPQGFIRNANGVCQQMCRGCQTGICLQGECMGELCKTPNICNKVFLITT